MRHLTVAIVFAVVLTSGMVPAAAPAAALAAHRARYDLHLEQGRNDVIAGTGSMEYEVSDGCDAWVVRQRLHMQLTGKDGSQSEMLSDYSTVESKDGKTLRFRLRQTNDGKVSSEIAGIATKSATGGVVNYSLPETATKKLPPGTLFPMAHTAALLAAAQAGKKFIAVPLFDGTGTSGAQNSAIAIAGWNGAAKSAWPALAKLSSGRVRIAFFDRDSNNPQADYEVGMRYFVNGVADNLSMDFGDFVMGAKLSQLIIAKPGC